jgi:cyanophycinase-like exopeptidase
MVPSGIKIGKEQLSILAYADDIVLIGKIEIEIRQLFVEMDNTARKLQLQINREKTKYMIVEKKNSLKQNKIGHFKIKNYKFETVANFKYLGVILIEDNHQIDLQRRIKNANKTYFTLQFFLKNNNILKKTKIKTKEHNNRQNVNICIRNLDTNTKRQKAKEHF